jgi:hypothetical protein
MTSLPGTYNDFRSDYIWSDSNVCYGRAHDGKAISRGRALSHCHVHFDLAAITHYAKAHRTARRSFVNLS